MKTRMVNEIGRKMEEIGGRLQILRKLMKLSHSDMAELLHTNSFHYRKIEAGLDMEIFTRDGQVGRIYWLGIYEKYGVRSDWVFTGTGNPFQFCGTETPEELFRIFNYLFVDNWKTYDVEKWRQILDDSSNKNKILSMINDFEQTLHEMEATFEISPALES